MQAPRQAESALLAQGVEVLRSPKSRERLALGDVLELLAARGITRLMVEGGPTLAAALIAADLVDEAVLYHSGKVVGAEGLDALDAEAMAALTQRLHKTVKQPIGADRRRHL